HRGGEPPRHGPQHDYPEDPGIRHRRCRRLGLSQAAFRRFASSRASTVATISSTAALRMPFCAPIAFTRRSVRSMLGAPAATARAADEGVTSDWAAAAYFSKGTRSFWLAPSVRQSCTTQL